MVHPEAIVEGHHMAKRPVELIIGPREGPQDLAGTEIERVEHIALAHDKDSDGIAGEIEDVSQDHQGVIGEFFRQGSRECSGPLVDGVQANIGETHQHGTGIRKAPEVE